MYFASDDPFKDFEGICKEEWDVYKPGDQLTRNVLPLCLPTKVSPQELRHVLLGDQYLFHSLKCK